MTVIYKSKDVDYMSKLKKAVLKGMHGSTPDNKQYTWDYVRKQVTLDDLQSYAVAHLGKVVKFPTDHYNAKIMMVFLNPPEPHEREIIDKMTAALQIPKEQVYVTWLNKVTPDSNEENTMMTTIINSEMSIIDPQMILSFGLNFSNEFHKVTDFKNAKLMQTYDMDWMFKEDENSTLDERKRALWEDVLQILQYYKSN